MRSTPVAGTGSYHPRWRMRLGVLIAASMVSGCGSTAPGAAPARPLDPPPPASDPGLSTLPSNELGTQRMIRLRYQGPRDDGTLYLTLRLERADRYTLEGNARLLGRSIFRLMVDGQRAIFLDVQRSEYCRFERAIEISAVPLGPLPFDVLPALLLGRLPVEPVSPSRIVGGEELSFRDREGREWTARVGGGRVLRWTLWRRGEPAVWWFEEAGTSYLSAREEGLQLRWRAGAAEPLRAALGAPSVPDGFVLAQDCGSA